MKVLTTLDLAKNQIINLRIENQSSAPQNPVEGQIYYDTTDHTVKQYNGTAWVEMGSSYTLPTASASTLGGVKIGDNVEIDANGVLTSKNTVEVELTNDNKSILTPTYIKTTYYDNGITPIFLVKITNRETGELLQTRRFVISKYDVEEGKMYAFFLSRGTQNISLYSYIFTETNGYVGGSSYPLQEALTFNTTYDPTTNKAATMTDITSAISALGTLLDLKGTKATYAEIEAIVNPEVGDVWICTADNSEYVYVDGDPSGHWEKLGPTIDLSGYLQIANLASDLTGESTTTAPTQKAVHDALALKADATTALRKATGTIAANASSATISITDATEVAVIRAYITSSGAEVIVDSTVNIANETVTISVGTHTDAITVDVFYR